LFETRPACADNRQHTVACYRQAGVKLIDDRGDSIIAAQPVYRAMSALGQQRWKRMPPISSKQNRPLRLSLEFLLVIAILSSRILFFSLF